jgi:outer membrane immunogenic protein
MGLRAILAGLTMSSFAVIGAQAADTYSPGPGSLKDVPYVEAPWSWTGFYGGATAGYGGGTSRNYVSANDNNPHGWAENDPDGGLIGLTVGYNYQWAPNWVVGAEADLSYGNLEGTQHLYIYDGHDWSGGWDGFGTIRGRLGYAVGHTLFYGTAGIAFLHTNEVIIGNDADESNSSHGWHTGYVVGAGVEHAFTDHFTGKIEYLYADGFNEDKGLTGTVSQQGTQYYIHDVGNLSIVRLGLNYKF